MGLGILELFLFGMKTAAFSLCSPMVFSQYTEQTPGVSPYQGHITLNYDPILTFKSLSVPSHTRAAEALTPC